MLLAGLFGLLFLSTLAKASPSLSIYLSIYLSTYLYLSRVNPIDRVNP